MSNTKITWRAFQEDCVYIDTMLIINNEMHVLKVNISLMNISRVNIYLVHIQMENILHTFNTAPANLTVQYGSAVIKHWWGKTILKPHI